MLPSVNQWAWMSGSNSVNQTGTYGTEDKPATTNMPGAREGAVSWRDGAGNLWLFGGSNATQNGAAAGLFNDLWVYSDGEWIWMSGSSSANQPGVYGTEGTPAATNVPGAREGAVSWTDPAGNFWLLGGYGYDSTGKQGQLNDLWVYSKGEWTWISGSNLANQPGAYGTKGTAAAANTPGARVGAISWTDAAGNLWLFGGNGYDSTGTQGDLNDLWVYSKKQWTWVSGSDLANQAGTYGTEGKAASTNVPGAREGAVSWIDPGGNLWLFGGTGLASSTSAGDGYLNDLWVYSKGEWVWMSGSDSLNQAGSYGTVGQTAATNVPGAREGAVSWTDPSGNFWLFGGVNANDNGTPSGFLNDLWVYSGNQWTWVNGSSSTNQPGTYGTEGTPATANMPGGRYGAVSWADGAGNLWLFGGNGYASSSTNGYLNDLWVYRP